MYVQRRYQHLSVPIHSVACSMQQWGVPHPLQLRVWTSAGWVVGGWRELGSPLMRPVTLRAWRPSL